MATILAIMSTWRWELWEQSPLPRPTSSLTWTRPIGRATTDAGISLLLKLSVTEITMLLRSDSGPVKYHLPFIIPNKNREWSCLSGWLSIMQCSFYIQSILSLLYLVLMVQGCLQYFFGNSGQGTVEAFNFNQPTDDYVGHLSGNNVTFPLILIFPTIRGLHGVCEKRKGSMCHWMDST